MTQVGVMNLHTSNCDDDSIKNSRTTYDPNTTNHYNNSNLQFAFVCAQLTAHNQQIALMSAQLTNIKDNVKLLVEMATIPKEESNKVLLIH